MRLSWLPGGGSRDSRLVAAERSAAEARQPVAAGEAEQDGEGERAGAEAEKLPPVHHKAWGAERLRALNGVLGAKLQPEGLLLEAVEAPWKQTSLNSTLVLQV